MTRSSAYAEAANLEIVPGVPATFVSRRLLLELKRRVGRPRDLDDIRRLEGAQGSDEPTP